jgi:hypothetical protein
MSHHLHKEIFYHSLVFDISNTMINKNLFWAKSFLTNLNKLLFYLLLAGSNTFSRSQSLYRFLTDSLSLSFSLSLPLSLSFSLSLPISLFLSHYLSLSLSFSRSLSLSCFLKSHLPHLSFFPLPFFLSISFFFIHSISFSLFFVTFSNIYLSIILSLYLSPFLTLAYSPILLLSHSFVLLFCVLLNIQSFYCSNFYFFSLFLSLCVYFSSLYILSLFFICFFPPFSLSLPLTFLSLSPPLSFPHSNTNYVTYNALPITPNHFFFIPCIHICHKRL